MVAAAVVYGLLWLAVLTRWSWLMSGDDRIVQSFHDIGVRNPLWLDSWRVMSSLFSPASLRLVAAVAIIAAVLRRQLRIAAFLGVTVMLSGVVTAVAKALCDRPRPVTALTHASSSSFPSGHALGITVAVLAFGTLLWPHLTESLRVPVLVVGASLVILVGVSRVVLNVHHPSDVVAGWALGLLYYRLCMALVPPRVRRPSPV